MNMLKSILFRLSEQNICGIVCSSKKLLKGARYIMTTPTALDKAIETLEKNPYYEKYQKKISEIRQESPDVLVTRWEEYQKSSKAKSQASVSKSNQMSTLSKPKSDVSSTSSGIIAHQKILNDVMKVDLIKDKTKEEIQEIWTKYFSSKDGIAGVVPRDVYLNIRWKSKMHPLFVLPLPRSQGYEFMMFQFNNNEIHFTSLINYQAFKENAPECLTMVYYDEMMQDKGIVLMRGEFDKNVLDSKEATCLANQIQLYYGENNEKRDKLLARFTNSPEEFKHMDLIAELECLTL
ncbi:ATP synthase mitochondrial F1 complex assembly factor 1 [Ischnura elegans]|uniref:ATP synthase mitochondrial F1 complex assembly factor 1 n=1 Tax=Ischnura elegans TaxID=197161 RepID=UPI001ED86B7C|nr:ATP synthase mitochondrial F1 complex assembly factor 1 [Ischnura elegans]